MRTYAQGLDRAAHASIRGYLSQMAYAARAWVEIGPDEYLVVEGQEDVDRFVFDENGKLRSVAEVQLKDLANAINVRSEAAYESVFNFLVAFHRHHVNGRQCRMLFTTTAARDSQKVAASTGIRTTTGGAPNKQRRHLDLSTDVLREWAGLSTKDGVEQQVLIQKLANDVRGLYQLHLAPQLPTSQPPADLSSTEAFAEAVKAALMYLDTNTLWTTFMLGVEWVFTAPDAMVLMSQLRASIEGHTLLDRVEPAAFAMRLVARVFEIASMKDPADRFLSRASLREEAQRTEADLRTWGTRFGFIHLAGWMNEFQNRLEAVEAELAKHLDDHRHSAPDAAELVRRLETGSVMLDQAERAWTAYFRSRVAPESLFVPPATFRLHRSLFALADFSSVGPLLDTLMAGMARQREDLHELYALLASRYGAGQHPILQPYPADPAVPLGPVAWADIFRVLATIGGEIDRLEMDFPVWQSGAEAQLAAEVKGHLSPDEQERFYDIVYRTVARRGELQSLRETVRRLRSPVWMLTSPAGRGKSTLIWYAARSLREAGHIVCILSPQHFVTGRDLLELCAAELSFVPPTRETFLAVVEHLWFTHGKASIIAIDAINEAPGSVNTTTSLVATLASHAIERPYLRLMLACRDYYWESTYSHGLKSADAAMVVESGHQVQPHLTSSAVAHYLSHFDVTDLSAAEILSPELFDNPFLLRVFCETYSGRAYDGPRPVRSTGIELLEGYIASRSSELRSRGFPASLDLDSELETLGLAMLKRIRLGRARGVALSFAVLLSDARRLLSTPGANQQTLLDAVLDMDLVLRRDLPVGREEEVLFTFERMGSYFQARALLSPLSGLGMVATEAEFSATWRSENLSRDALGMLIAVALSSRLLATYPEESVEALEAFPAVADLVGDRILPVLSSDALERAARHHGVAALTYTATRYIREGTAFEQKGFALFALIARSLGGRSVVQRHGEFFANRPLVERLTEFLEHDLSTIRHWVKSRFQTDVPTEFLRGPSTVPLCCSLLGANCDRTRNAAHEWLFWWGHWQPTQGADLAIELLDDTDIVVRERAIALLCGILERFPDTATEARLRAVYSRFLALPPEERTGVENHYFITEFARRVILDHRLAAKGVVPELAWGWIEAPTRLRPAPEVIDADLHAANPAWERSGPVGSDMAHYTFGHMFQYFAVDRLQPVVEQVLKVLPAVGYDESAHEQLDAELRGLPESRPGEGFRFERFGKLLAYQAAHIVLGTWAGSVPVQRSVSAPSEPFALDEPSFDYMFTLEPDGGTDTIEAELDFPTDIAWEDWAVGDEREYLRKFLETFPEEVVLWGVARRTKNGRRFVVKVEMAFVFSDAVPALTWLERSRNPREEFYGWVPREPVETGDFHTVARAVPSTQGALGWDEPVLSCSTELIRTLHHADKSVISPSPSIVHALGLRSLPTAGEYADGEGNIVVRQVEWGDTASEHSAHLLLMKRDALAEAAAKLGCSLGQFEYMDAGAIDDSELGGIDRDHFYRRWGASFEPAVDGAVPPFLDAIVGEFKVKHGYLGEHLLLRAHETARREGEEALRALLDAESRQAWRRMRVKFDRSVIPHIDDIRYREKEDE